MNSFTELFDSVKNYCLENKKIPSVAITTWLNMLTPVSFDGENAVFSVITPFQKNIVISGVISAFSILKRVTHGICLTGCALIYCHISSIALIL